MSYLSSLIACPGLQSKINGYFGCDKARLLKLNETGLTQFLFSPVNTNGVLNKTVAPGGNKIKTIELIYTPRIKTEDISTSINRENCTAVTPHGNRSETYTIDPNVGISVERKINAAELAFICESDESYIQSVQMDMMDGMMRAMDPILADQVVLLAGNFGVDEVDVTDDVKTVATQNGTGGLSDNFISEINFAADNAGYCATPYVLGYGEIQKAYTKLDASCCADSGMNVALLAGQVGLRGSFIPDRYIKQALGSGSDFITLDAGAVQVLTYNAFEGKNSFMQDTYVQTTITHPSTGVTFDFRATYDCGNWNFFMFLAFKAVGVPNDLYYSGDIYDGVTGVNKYKITNPA